MPMDTSVVVSVIAAASGVIVTAASYYLTKKKEREADWRKYKFEQYKEFMVSISGIVAGTRLWRATDFLPRLATPST
jgi:hypothetical protein